MMQSSDSTTASDTTASTSPLSPFSTLSVPSEPTSDELPDLGAFTTVLRAWNHLQPAPRILHQPHHSTSTVSSMEPESDDLREPSQVGSTVWSQRPIASYLDSILATTDTDGRSPSPPRSPSLGSGSNTEGDARTLELETVGDYELSDLEDLDLDPPSLGLLDGALSFIAAERARWTAQREADAAANEGAWKHVVEPRRKRRRKRNARNPKPDDPSRDDPIEEAESLAAEDADDSSSSFDNNTTTTTTTTTTHKSVPATPNARSRKERRRQALANTSGSPSANRVLIHSKSTPQLRNSVLPLSFNNFAGSHEGPRAHPRVVQLLTLAKKLGKVFPADKAVLDGLIPDPADDTDPRLQALVDNDFSFVDPRGPPPGPDDTLIHVFIDHSNILIGLLTYLRRYPRSHAYTNHTSSSSVSVASNSTQTQTHTHTHTHLPTPAPSITSFSFPPKPSPKSKHLSHAALALILERGRPISRRVLVTSSPLYQPMDGAERLGYEVRVYARVPDLGDGQDRVGSAGEWKKGWRRRRGGGHGGRPQGHNRSLSAGAGGLMGFMNGNTQNGNGAGGVVQGEFPTLKNPRWGGNGMTNGANGMGGGDGASGNGGGGRKGRKGHVRRVSGSQGSTSTESEQGQQMAMAGFPQAFIRSLGGGSAPISISTSPPSYSSPMVSSSLPMTNGFAGSPTSLHGLPNNPHAGALAGPGAQGAMQKIKYREQGVDELLQLKLHQALAALDGPPPPGATIVLATGDGNVGQFNEDGFLGPVRTALKKGWRVELYAWEEGLSRSWMREFGEWTKPRDGEETGRFRVVGMEQFAAELLEIY
ncbi:hypothetical protein MVEN_00204500 [Mycena venus]|uniref:NYN domain-containing protein n=1 Tax=Mycena venus TaxID=2733690 RepID=A0A8H6Z1L8_9AGAR|nr:hypothetical protein MVEN_00204500 [Mycena venus]